MYYPSPQQQNLAGEPVEFEESMSMGTHVKDFFLMSVYKKSSDKYF